jgi:hypothetical protein
MILYDIPKSNWPSLCELTVWTRLLVAVEDARVLVLAAVRVAHGQVDSGNNVINLTETVAETGRIRLLRLELIVPLCSQKTAVNR